jgi:hypothetical protein
MSASDQPGNKPFAEFLLHVIFGGVAFLLIFLVAVGVGAIVGILQGAGYVSDDLAIIMHFAEPCIFVVDLILFVIFSITEGAKLIGKLWVWRHA